jgi:hypothetical protein
MESKPPLRCSVCATTCTAEEEAMGWPLVAADQLVCPACYGPEAFCRRRGHVLSAVSDSTECAECEEGAEG